MENSLLRRRSSDHICKSRVQIRIKTRRDFAAPRVPLPLFLLSSSLMAATIEASFKNLGLSLEPPYKDDSGERILELEDITDTGERIYRP